MSVFEAVMLACFGASWPFSIAKSLRTRQVTGKSPAFLIIISVGYISGIVHKVVYAMDWVVILYGLNLAMVLFDLYLYRKFRANNNLG